MPTDTETGEPYDIKDNFTQICLSVWDQVVGKICVADHIAIIAHREGGEVVSELLKSTRAEMQKVQAITFIDSNYHSALPSLESKVQ